MPSLKLGPHQINFKTPPNEKMINGSSLYPVFTEKLIKSVKILSENPTQSRNREVVKTA